MVAILRGLVKRGHECTMIALENSRDMVLDGIQILVPPPADPERSRWFIDQYRECDVAMTHLNCTGHAMHLAMETAKPLVHLVHNDKQLHFHNVRPIRAQLLIYNSEWVRDASPMNPSIVVHPIVEPDGYRVERPDPQTVTFVNLTVTKGALVFYELARRIFDTPFVGIRGAYGDQHNPPTDVPNLTILEQRPCLRDVYANTKVVLMPSDYESFGRVAVEAACSGIPSIVHPTPGLKEALGPAGIYIDRKDVDAWEVELRRLLNDADYYAERSAAAFELAASLKPEASLDKVEWALEIVKQHGLRNSGWTFEALGAEAYIQKAKDLGHGVKDEAGFRPSLGGIAMNRPAFTTDRQIYLNSRGEPVERSAADKQILYMGENATISFDQALEMGILNEAGIPFWDRYESQAFAEPAQVQSFDGPGLDDKRPFLNSDAVAPLTQPGEVEETPRRRRRRTA